MKECFKWENSMCDQVCLGPMSSEKLAVKFRVWDQSFWGVSGSHLGAALQRGPWPTLVVQRMGRKS